MEAIETITSRNMPEMSVSLYQDEDAQNPRRDYDPLGHMICWHRNYDLGDEKTPAFSSPDEFADYAKTAPEMHGALIIPLFLYDHGGITMRAGTGFSCPWDSGQVGYIYMTRAEIVKEFGRGKNARRVSKRARTQARESLMASVAEYADYLEGNVYGYVVKMDGEDAGGMDSCWGHIGHKWAIESARAALGAEIRARRKALREGRAAEILAAGVAYSMA